MPKVAFDAGHGIDTYDRTGGKGVPDMEEHDFNASVVKRATELAEYNGIDVVLTQKPFGLDTPLDDRTDLANNENVDILMSFHADANSNENARGHWGFYWYTSDSGQRLANIWSKHISKETGTHHRGNRESKPNSWTNFHMVRETKKAIPSVLMEHAFMTNEDDLKLLMSNEFREQCAVAAVKTVCEYFGLKYKEPEDEGTTVKYQDNDINGFIKEGRTYVEVRELAELLGLSVGWDQETKTVTLK